MSSQNTIAKAVHSAMLGPNMSGNTKLRSAVHLLLTATATMSVVPVYAQETEEVIVTGSRIRRAGFDTLEPATVVTKEYIDLRGLTNVADALNEIPGFGVGITPEGGQASFGTGVNFVNRFGLGTNRTLTLVNGRRFVASNPPTLFGPAAPGIQVDLNAVPTALVERVENLAIGGAPTYGADAIAGVVNVITRKDYEGTEFSTGYGSSEHGGSDRYNASGLFGMNFGADDRGNVTFALSYDRVDGVHQRERDFFRAAYLNATNPAAATMATVFPGRTPANDGRYDPSVPFNTSATDGIPNGVLIANRRIWTTPFGGLISPTGAPFRPGSSSLIPNGFGPAGDVVLAFDPSGNLVPYSPGSTFAAVDASGGDGLDLVEASQITSDLERKSFSTTVRFGVTEAIDLFVEGTYYTADSTELVDQWAYNSPLFGGTSGGINFPATHPMLTQQASTTLAGLGVTGFSMSKASRDLVTNNGSGTTDIGRIVTGLEGEFDAAGREFYWETYVNYGRNDADSLGTSLIQQNFINALNVVLNAQGQPVCSPTPIPGLVIPGGNTPVADSACVPLDMFGEQRPSQAARAYVTEPTTSNSLLEQEVFNVNLSSTVADLWSGPLEYNIGFEYREEKGRFDPDPILQQGLGRSVPITPLQGDYHTNELFLELIVPLVNPENDRLLAKKFEIVTKYRSVDNSITGQDDAYTYGLQWAPIEDFEIRGNFTRSLRAPAITELFLPQATSFQFVTNDPCDSRFITGGPNPAVRQVNCQAFLSYYGLATFTSNAAGASIQGVSGGNPNLGNEVADSLTYGFSWSPRFAEGLSVAADYYRIEIDSVISNLTATQLASACYDNAEFNAADVPNGNSFCSKIARNAPGTTGPGQATTFTSGFVNGRFYDLEASSLEVRYQFDTDMGQFAFAALGYFPKEAHHRQHRCQPRSGSG